MFDYIVAFSVVMMPAVCTFFSIFQMGYYFLAFLVDIEKRRQEGIHMWLANIFHAVWYMVLASAVFFIFCSMIMLVSMQFKQLIHWYQIHPLMFAFLLVAQIFRIMHWALAKEKSRTI